MHKMLEMMQDDLVFEASLLKRGASDVVFHDDLSVRELRRVIRYMTNQRRAQEREERLAFHHLANNAPCRPDVDQLLARGDEIGILLDMQLRRPIPARQVGVANAAEDDDGGGEAGTGGDDRRLLRAGIRPRQRPGRPLFFRGGCQKSA